MLIGQVTSIHLLFFKSKLALIYELFWQSINSLNNEDGFQENIIYLFFNKIPVLSPSPFLGTHFINYLPFNGRYILKIISVFQIR